jgi:hypothetical protein
MVEPAHGGLAPVAAGLSRVSAIDLSAIAEAGTAVKAAVIPGTWHDRGEDNRGGFRLTDGELL